MKRNRLWLLALGISSLAFVSAVLYDLTRVSPALSSLPKGGDEVVFAHGSVGALDLDTLETGAIPWKLAVAALALAEAKGDGTKASMAGAEAALGRVGFLFPGSFANSPATSKPGPLGINVGTVERSIVPLRVEVANLGCASCHAGVSYGPDGRPRPDAPWLGMPNTSLDLEGYATTLYAAIKSGLSDRPALDTTITRLFPEMGWRERSTLRFVVLPKVEKRIAGAKAEGDRPLPFPNGAPGMTNGVAALKLRLGLPISPDGGPGFVSIPDLGAIGFRSALLADGAYARKGRPRFSPVTAEEAAKADARSLAEIASFFTVPSMGMTSHRALGAIPELTAAARFVLGYAPQPYPGRIDATLLPRGREVYADRCAACHGSYVDIDGKPRLTSFPNWHGDVSTDSARSSAFTPALAAAVSRTPHGDLIDASSTGGYVAPALSGVWATAPYFVNGSVPTLRALLEPDTRPARFPVGGHALNLADGGIALESKGNEVGYPTGYVPFSNPVVYDTAKPGQSNRGHEREVQGIPAVDRDALLEYLKTL